MEKEESGQLLTWKLLKISTHKSNEHHSQQMEIIYGGKIRWGFKCDWPDHSPGDPMLPGLTCMNHPEGSLVDKHKGEEVHLNAIREGEIHQVHPTLQRLQPVQSTGRHFPIRKGHHIQRLTLPSPHSPCSPSLSKPLCYPLRSFILSKNIFKGYTTKWFQPYLEPNRRNVINTQ